MWKALLAFATHRTILLVAALLAINAKIPSEGESRLPRLHSTQQLWHGFVEKLSQAPELPILDRLATMPSPQMIHDVHEPFLWICRWFMDFTSISPLWSLILLSNFFFLFFLFQLNALLTRVTTSDIVMGAVMLAVVWPASYEHSIGSPEAFSAFLLVWGLKAAIDNQWLIVGLSFGVLLIADPIALFMVPFLAYVFWYYQRHYLIPQVIKRLVFFLLPFGIAVMWRWDTVTDFPRIAVGSAVFDVIRASNGQGVNWAFNTNYLGQTLSLLFLVVGAGVSLFSSSLFMHRMLPIYTWLAFLLCTPFSQLASRAMLASLCFEGIASASSLAVEKVLTLTFLGLGAYEVFRYFIAT